MASGVEPGDRVAVVATSSATLLCLIIGAVRRSITPVMINPALLVSEQDALIADAQVSLVVRDFDLLALVGGPPVELEQVPLCRPMHYTSGTSGMPKGVLGLGDAGHLFEEERQLWGFEAADVHLICSPLHHSAPVRFATGTLMAGGSVLVPSKFDASAAALAIRAHRPTTTFMAPAHMQRLLDLGNGTWPSFRLVAHAGSACPEPLKRAALAAFPRGSVWEFYGSTEGQFTACAPSEWEERPGTVGRARSGRRIEVDQAGAIWCDVPPYARFEYWRDPVKTAQAWKGSAFTVGDLGRLDDEGYLFIDGRRDDLIISGGVNVYPAEVERVLATMSGVVDIAVFGVADDRWGQRVCAAVVGDVRASEVVAFARQHLAAYKCPKDVVSVAEIPVGSMGKVRRGELAAVFGL